MGFRERDLDVIIKTCLYKAWGSRAELRKQTHTHTHTHTDTHTHTHTQGLAGAQCLAVLIRTTALWLRLAPSAR